MANNVSMFRNWHKPSYWARAKKQEMSTIFPVSVSRYTDGGIELNFQKEFGDQISFYLNKEDKEFLINQLLEKK